MRPQIEIIHGDITTLHVDVIVNAANSSLLGEAAWMALFIALPGRNCSKLARPCVNNRGNVRRGMP